MLINLNSKKKSKVPAAVMVTVLCLPLISCQHANDAADSDGLKFTVTYDVALSDEAQDGRLLLLLATHDKEEPRFLVNSSADTQLIFGLNVQDWQAGTGMVIDENTMGYPLTGLSGKNLLAVVVY